MPRRPLGPGEGHVQPGVTRLPNIGAGYDLKQKAYRALKDAILQKVLVGGPLYREQALAQQLGVSRTPVREALLMLATEGWVKYEARRGVGIIQSSLTEIRQCFQLREALEGYAVEVLAGRLHPDAADALSVVIERQARQLARSDWGGFMKEAHQFHRLLIVELHNERMLKFFDQLTEHLQLFGLRAIARQRAPAHMLAEHRELLVALRDGRGPRARRLMVTHIRRTMAAQAPAAVGQQKSEARTPSS
jgi:DNA-binding GntR family transcriptional regulator